LIEVRPPRTFASPKTHGANYWLQGNRNFVGLPSRRRLGKFYRPDARFNPPVHFDPEVLEWLEERLTEPADMGFELL